ncbi:MAG TPA: TobH protein [Mycobacterium sp.]|uniref:TobH protein n=1 Tax=Mycolicibacterium sp. TaxID=2320850 RepID=UPI0025D8CAD4|nr:TobH protein [Mycolicibacterium sp.]HPX37286.1 TobH protein [Mycobacterium sp.]HQC77378.1 TobH protein [Mycobacterium sp.]
MSAAHATVDLDDTEGLLDADRDGLLRAAATAGAQVRATAAAVEEGALESVAGDQRPRTVVWVAGRGPAESAGAMLAAALSGTTGAPIVTVAESPPWIGPLDVLIAAGDDPGDPALVGAAAIAVRRGARVVVAAPYEGPLRDATAGRAAVLAPRLWVPDEFGLSRYLAAGLATFSAVDPSVPAPLAELADSLDAEAARNSAAREVFTNPAKALADRISGRPTVLAGDCAATLALARHGAAVLLRVAGEPVAAAGLGDALAALRTGIASRFGDSVDALFHDEEIDGPLPGRPRVVALALAAERQTLSARVSGIDGVELIGADDVGTGDVGAEEFSPGDLGAETSGSAPGPGRVQDQLAILALRLEMAAVYLRLAGG